MVIYFFIYLIELLKRGHSEEVEKILDELDESQMIPISEVFLFVPKGSNLEQDSVITGNLHLGTECKLVGNYLIRGNLFIGKKTEVYGAMRTSGKIWIEDNARVEGNVESDEIIELGKCHIGGDLRGKKIVMSQGTVVKGVIHAAGGIQFKTKQIKAMEEKVGRLKDNVERVDEVANLLK